MIHDAYIRKVHDADGKLVGFETDWREIPKFVIRTHTYSLRWVWVTGVGYGVFEWSFNPRDAMDFIDCEEARQVRRDLKKTNPGLPFLLAVRPGRKKV